MKQAALKEFLDQKVQTYNTPQFLSSDPIQIPHRFSKKEDIEIAGFLTATIAWGNRKSIITNANKLMHLMDDDPYEFIVGHSATDLERFEGFVHRTFNSIDACYFMQALQQLYKQHGGLETVFTKHANQEGMQMAIHKFKEVFFSWPHPERSKKHVSDPLKNSAAKRINMYLRWMVRQDNHGVDFGIWKEIAPALLSCPLDVHSGNVARKLKLLKRKQNDAKALQELDASLRKLDPVDPVKYDFALFGLGVFEGF